MTFENFYQSVVNGVRRILIGCLKLQVISRKRATNYRALLRKMIYKDIAVGRQWSLTKTQTTGHERILVERAPQKFSKGSSQLNIARKRTK